MSARVWNTSGVISVASLFFIYKILPCFASSRLCDPLTTLSTVLEEICNYANDPANEIWVDTIETIGKYVIKQRTR